MKRATKKSGASRTDYALVTAAYNEERYIEYTLQSVVGQTVQPRKWIVVSDGSTDRTDQIVRRYADQYEFIELYKIPEEHPRSPSAQVSAINRGLERLRNLDCSFVGNLDADVSFGAKYFESLLEEFSRNPALGLAGGFIYEQRGKKFCCRGSNSLTSVAHAVQLFRRESLETLGGYRLFSWAGADWHAEVSVRMNGWRVWSFPELMVFHHRPTGSGFGLLRYWYRGGLMDFYMGTHPVFEVFKVVRRFCAKPFIVGALIRLVAFLWASCRGEQRQVPDEFVRFLRKEQMRRLRPPWKCNFGNLKNSFSIARRRIGS